MYKAGQADAKTGSVDTGVSEMGSASAEGSQGVENGARSAETANGVQATETAETSPSTEQSGTVKTEQQGKTTTQKSGSEVNPELEEKLAPFKLSSEERAAAEEYARTGKDSAFSNKFDRDTVKRIMDAAAVIKEHNGNNGIDSQQGEGYNVEDKGKILSSKIYTPVDYKGTVKVNGEVRDVSRRVYQRNDIDIKYYDEVTGLTNLERMLAGKPPIGSDGNPIELHHILQQEVGPMAELREITHQQYYSQLHGLIENGASFRNNPLLNKQYNNFRYNYWKWRASLITGGK